MTIDFDFDLYSKVIIKAIEMIGIIDSMAIGYNGKMYEVIYWNNGERKSEWIYAFEIKAENDK